jgi:prepilin-type N-terminal cleavage/methylation domain-containing protein
MNPAQYTKYNSQHTFKAYTLIEILIVLAVMGLLFSFGFVSFRDFSRRKIVSGTAEAVRGNLRMAQNNATSGTRPEGGGCDSKVLENYSFRVYDPGAYRIEANCMGAVLTNMTVRDVVLPAGIFISVPSPNPLEFKAMGWGNNIAAGSISTITISQEGTTNAETITVSAGGEIQ